MSIILRSTRQWGRLVWRVSRGQSKVTVQLDNILIREYITQRLTRKLSQSYIFQGNLAHYFLFCKFPELFLLDCQASLYITNSQSLLKLMSIELVMPSNHLILCCPRLLLPSIFPSIRVFSSELVLHIRWPKYWSFSFSITYSNEYSGLISFRMDWLDLLAVQGTLKSLPAPQFKSINSSVYV